MVDDPDFWSKMLPEVVPSLDASAAEALDRAARESGADRLRASSQPKSKDAPDALAAGIARGKELAAKRMRGEMEDDDDGWRDGGGGAARVDRGGSRAYAETPDTPPWSNEELKAVEAVMLAVGHAKAPTTIRRGLDGMSASNSKLAPSERASEALAGALGKLAERKGQLRDARRICDAMLVGWLKYSNDEALSSWMPLSLHVFSSTQVRTFGGELPPPPKRAKTLAAAAANAPIKRTRDVVQSLGFHGRPQGNAPMNDRGERCVWSYVRGVMVDVGGAGSTWKGVSADPDEPFKLELENTELDARIAALNAGYDADDIRDASLEQVKAMTKRAAAAALEDSGVEADHEGAEAAAAVAAAKTPPSEQILRAAIPKLEARLLMDVSALDPEWYEARLKEKAEGGIAMLVHALERKTDAAVDWQPRNAANVNTGCQACAGKHRPHTCGRGMGRGSS